MQHVLSGPMFHGAQPTIPLDFEPTDEPVATAVPVVPSTDAPAPARVATRAADAARMAFEELEQKSKPANVKPVDAKPVDAKAVAQIDTSDPHYLPVTSFTAFNVMWFFGAIGKDVEEYDIIRLHGVEDIDYYSVQDPIVQAYCLFVWQYVKGLIVGAKIHVKVIRVVDGLHFCEVYVNGKNIADILREKKLIASTRTMKNPEWCKLFAKHAFSILCRDEGTEFHLPSKKKDTKEEKKAEDVLSDVDDDAVDDDANDDADGDDDAADDDANDDGDAKENDDADADDDADAGAKKDSEDEDNEDDNEDEDNEDEDNEDDDNEDDDNEDDDNEDDDNEDEDNEDEDNEDDPENDDAESDKDDSSNKNEEDKVDYDEEDVSNIRVFTTTIVINAPDDEKSNIDATCDSNPDDDSGTDDEGHVSEPSD